MVKRASASASLIATLALSGIAGGVAAQEPADGADAAATSKSTTGMIVLDGTGYYLKLDVGTLVALSYGTSWFWGPLSPLHALVDPEVTVDGQLRDFAPNEHASDTAKAKAAKAPRIKVRGVGGQKLGDLGKPAWAGGPEPQSDVHPGHAGWSKGQATNSATADKRGGPPER